MVYDVLRQLRPLVLNSARVVGDRVSAEGWTVGMRAVIEVLVEGGDATVPMIAQRMDLSVRVSGAAIGVLSQSRRVSIMRLPSLAGRSHAPQAADPSARRLRAHG